MIHISGLDLNSSKKEQGLPSKYLSRKAQKTLMDKIGKKQKCTKLGEITGQIKAEQQDLFMRAFACSSMVAVMRFKVGQQHHTCAIHTPSASHRNEDGDYFWEEVVNYEKSGFVAFLEEPETVFMQSSPDTMLANIYGGDEEQDNAAVIYDEQDEMIYFGFAQGEPSSPRLNLTRFKDLLPTSLTTEQLDDNN